MFSARYALRVEFKKIARSIWDHDVVFFARGVVRDLAKFAILLMGLEFFWILLRQMELTGYPTERLAYFDKLHFCGTWLAVLILTITFLIKLVADLYKGKR